MAIASPSAPSFCCTTRSDSTHRRFSHPVSFHFGPKLHSPALARPALAARIRACSDDGGDELVHGSNHNRIPQRRDVFPVYVTLPLDAVGPTAQTMRRKRAMVQSFRALALAGVEGVVMEVWWGLVERESPGSYCWRGYLEIVEMAERLGLKVRAAMAFHQCGSDPDDPFWIPLPLWVLEEMDKDPDISYADKFGRRNMEYISLGCDEIPVLRGRTPVQAYADFMSNFRDTFRPFLGGIITGIQIGLGPGGELRYPSSPAHKLWGWQTRELGEFQCYDKYMIASLNACATEKGVRGWGNGGPIGASSLTQNPENTDFFRSDGSWKTPYGEFFLGWYSEMLLSHAERICQEAQTVFRDIDVIMSAKIAGVHWHYGAPSHPSELTSGYYNTDLRDGYIPIFSMFHRFRFTVCCVGFEMRDSEELQMNPFSRPESLVKQLLLAARTCNVPLEGENYLANLDDGSFKQVLRMSKFYTDGLETPSFSFNFVRMDKNLFESRNWNRFTRFVRHMSAVNMIQSGPDFSGGGNVGFPSAAALAY